MTQRSHFNRDYLWGFRRYQFLSFMMLGIINPWLAPLFESRGMDKSQVGWLMAIFGLMALVSPPIWGAAADSSRDRRVPLLVAFAASAILFWGYHFSESFVALVAMTVLFGAIFKSVIPMGISLTFAWAETERRDYSRIRLFGTMGYVASLVLMSAPLKRWGIDAIFPCFLIFAALAASGLYFLPKIRGAGHRKLDWHAVKLLGRRNFAITVICTFLAQGSMAAHYSFFSQFMMNDLHVKKEYLTFFWAFGSVFEVIMLTQAGRLIKRFGTKWVLTAGMAGMALRLGLYVIVPVLLAGSVFHLGPWTIPTVVAVIFLVQGMHAFTFGAVHASTVTFVNYAAPTKWRASAQTMFEGITIGLGMSMGALVGGHVSQAGGYPVLFACASGAAGLACVVYAIFGRSVSLVRRPDEELPGEGLGEE